MCLDRVDRVYKGTGRKEVIRYKHFLNYKGMRLPLWALYNFAKIDSIPKGVWLNERLYRPYSLGNSVDTVLKNKNGGRYPTGWHVYVSELFGLYALRRRVSILNKILAREAKNIEGCSIGIYEVRCKGILATGIEKEWHQDRVLFDAPVEVYRYIKISNRISVGYRIGREGILCV